MTAETLKPFITPTSAVDTFPAKQSTASHSPWKCRQHLTTFLTIAGLALLMVILSLTIWQSWKVTHLDRELKGLKRVVDSLQQRLGINYLEDIDEFEKEYENALIEDPGHLDAIEDEEDDDVEEDNDDDTDYPIVEDDYDDYDDLVKKYKGTGTDTTEGSTTTPAEMDTSASSASNDDNVFEDFTSYNDSKKKKERKSRSIAELRNDVQSYSLQNKTQELPTTVKDGPSLPHHRRRLRPRTSRQRVLLRKGDSFLSAKSTNPQAISRTPAAHFHLNRKVSHHNAPLQLNSYQGDMYIGHVTASNDNSWQDHFSVNNGILTVHQSGLYYVYAQICYNNSHDQNGFIIFHGHNAFLQCLNTVPTNMPQKIHTCHTSGLIQLQEQESIHLRDIHQDRNVMLRDSNNRSYFGIIKV